MDSAAKEGRWWPAPAKLNLFLHVTGRRADGFHELQTLFQLLDWGDEVYLRATDKDEIRRRNAEYDIAPGRDLAVRAARELKAATACAGGAVIEVKKKIPIGAGLGGGSSDAATVLVVLNRLWGCGLESTELADLGLKLGADVPVFVYGRSAMATGVGEVLAPVSLGERHYTLVLPELQVSTARVFADEGLERKSRPISLSEAVAGGGRNDCQPVACAMHPELGELIEYLKDFGAPRMSGTGSAVFLPMPDGEAAKSTAKALLGASARDLKCRYNVRAVGGRDRSPLLGKPGNSPAGT